MKKIGIITLHFSINYGAVLQCAALIKKMESLGNKAEAIDYVPEYLERYWKSWKSPIYACKCQKAYCGKNVLKTFVKLSKAFWRTLWENRNYIERKKKENKFEDFKKKYIPLSRVRFSTAAELNAGQFDYDCMITGSDQVWNPTFTNNKFDEAYFLNFGTSHSKKIAYAASAGISGNEAFYKQLVENTKNLDAISVREKSLAEEMQKAGAKNVVSVIDPTLFLTGSEWEELETPKEGINEKYILIYCLAQHEEFVRILDKLHSRMELKIIDISPKGVQGDYIWKHDTTCGPDEFLWYIHHAELVLTNSFHGTVFSVLYEKKFITVADEKTGSRMKDLLYEIHLDDRLYSNEKAFDDYLLNSDFTKAFEAIKDQREIAEHFLIDNMGE